MGLATAARLPSVVRERGCAASQDFTALADGGGRTGVNTRCGTRAAGRGGSRRHAQPSSGPIVQLNSQRLSTSSHDVPNRNVRPWATRTPPFGTSRLLLKKGSRWHTRGNTAAAAAEALGGGSAGVQTRAPGLLPVDAQGSARPAILPEAGAAGARAEAALETRRKWPAGGTENESCRQNWRQANDRHSGHGGQTRNTQQTRESGHEAMPQSTIISLQPSEQPTNKVVNIG